MIEDNTIGYGVIVEGDIDGAENGAVGAVGIGMACKRDWVKGP
jgi:hypothetical protein